MATQRQVLQFYSAPGPMTAGDNYYSTVLGRLPNDVAKITQIVQGLAIHEYVASDFFGFEVPEHRRVESHIRYFAQMLDNILVLNGKPLNTPRKPEERIVGVCHHFTVLLVGILRAKRIPARARYGFGAYFNPGFYEDHSLCEYWNKKERRWVLVDPQFDETWRRKLHIKHNVSDVPRDQFLIAGDAWIKCRKGKAKPSQFGIFRGNLRGLWFVAGNVVKDVAALNKMEMLQWDAWGAMPRPNNMMKDKKRLKFFDELAALTREPDASFERLRKLYKDKKNRLFVPERVFNAVRSHLEKI